MRQSIIARFLLTVVAVAVFSAAFILTFRDAAFFQGLTPISWSSLVFFSIITIISFFLNIKALQVQQKQRFVQMFIGTLGAKFILSILFIAAFALYGNPSTKFFVIPFFLFFILFKGVELRFILRGAKQSTRYESNPS